MFTAQYKLSLKNEQYALHL